MLSVPYNNVIAYTLGNDCHHWNGTINYGSVWALLLFTDLCKIIAIVYMYNSFQVYRIYSSLSGSQLL